MHLFPSNTPSARIRLGSSETSFSKVVDVALLFGMHGNSISDINHDGIASQLVLVSPFATHMSPSFEFKHSSYTSLSSLVHLLGGSLVPQLQHHVGPNFK